MTSPDRGTGVVDWLFRNRVTGEYTIAQFPNVSLGIFLATVLVRWVLHPTGTAGTVVDVVGTLALVWWGLDELVRGVNPWRRFLGIGALTLVVVGLLAR